MSERKIERPVSVVSWFNGERTVLMLRGDDGDVIGRMCEEEHAEYAALSWNYHPKLVEALREAQEQIQRLDDYEGGAHLQGAELDAFNKREELLREIDGAEIVRKP